MSTQPDLAAPVVGTGRRRYLLIVLGVALGVVILDQLTKAWAVSVLLPRMQPGGGGPIDVIGPWVRLTYVENTGAAFSMGTGYTWIFTAIAAAVIVVILRLSRSLGSTAWAIALGGLLGGSVGNLLDRLTRSPAFGSGHVVDFIAFPNFPVFNVADSAITCSAVLMVLLSLRGIDYRGGARAAARG